MADSHPHGASLSGSRLSLPDSLAVHVEQLIVSGKLPVGTRIRPERELAEIWGVSRSSVREALRQLSLRGLIDRRPGRGTTVVGHADEFGSTLLDALDDKRRTLKQVMEVREIIEPAVTSRAAQRATASDLEKLVAVLDAMSDRVTAPKFVALDQSFHLCIARATGNPMLVSLVERVGEIVDKARGSSLHSHPGRVASVREHSAILDAIRAHDPAAAQVAAMSHLQSVQRRILQANTDEYGRQRIRIPSR